MAVATMAGHWIKSMYSTADLFLASAQAHNRNPKTEFAAAGEKLRPRGFCGFADGGDFLFLQEATMASLRWFVR